MDFARLYESKSIYVLTDADEKHMREIEMEQGIVTTPRYFAEGQKEINKKPRTDGSVAFRVDPQDVDEEYDDTDDSARESDEDLTPRTFHARLWFIRLQHCRVRGNPLVFLSFHFKRLASMVCSTVQK